MDFSLIFDRLVFMFIIWMMIIIIKKSSRDTFEQILGPCNGRSKHERPYTRARVLLAVGVGVGQRQ